MKRVALITGGSRGIGFGIALSLAKENCNLAIVGQRDEKDCKENLNQLKDLGADVLYCRGNVAKSEDRAKILEQVKTHFQRLDILVNNAGVAPKARNDLLEMTEESYDYVMDVNLKGPFFLTQSAAKWMIQQKKDNADFNAQIINISSISATVVSINRGEYCISKAGVSMSTQLFAVRMGEFGIPVFEVRPGIIATDMTSKVKEKYDKLIGEGLCVTKRWGQPADIGAIVASLVTSDFTYATGQVIMADGGLTIQRL